MWKQTTDDRRARRGSWRSRGWRALELTVYLSLLSAVALGWAMRSVYAEGERTLRRVVSRVANELGPTVVGSRPQLLKINGQRLMLGSKQSTLSVHEVLDRFEASCDRENYDPTLLLADAPDVPDEDPSMPAPLRAFLRLGPSKLSTWRADLETEGHFSCLASAPGARSLRGFVERASAFLDSGDLAELGELRFLTARKLDNGKTHVVSVWSEGSFHIGAMFPQAGDAPGSDMREVPRPPRARRLLTAAAHGRDYGMRIYASEKSASTIVGFYESELRERGFEPVNLDPVNGGALRENVLVRAFTRGEGAVIVSVGGGSEGEAASKASTSVSLIDMGAVRRAQVTAATR